MARPREFDPTKVLDAVMSEFWAHGFEATSMETLCSITGLSKSSLYAAFGNKHSLLLQALRRYIDIRIDYVRSTLLKDVSIRQNLTSFVAQLINDIVAGSGRRGCFLGNCAAEIERSDRKAMTLIRGGLIAMEDVFREALKRAVSLGEIDEQLDLDATPRFLVAGYQGLRLVGKVNPERSTLEAIASVLLNCIA
jgi:TetR/AcrR family transcriptional repressor of nem operon